VSTKKIRFVKNRDNTCIDMKKFFYLCTCDTCKRMMKELILTDFEIIDIKKTPISPSDLKTARKTVDSYQDLFNKRARKLKELKIDLSQLDDSKIETLILEEYSFLKRPLLLDGEKVLAGNSKSTFAEMKALYGTS
jgi:arsenate reductase